MPSADSAKAADARDVGRRGRSPVDLHARGQAGRAEGEVDRHVLQRRPVHRAVEHVGHRRVEPGLHLPDGHGQQAAAGAAGGPQLPGGDQPRLLGGRRRGRRNDAVGRPRPARRVDRVGEVGHEAAPGHGGQHERVPRRRPCAAMPVLPARLLPIPSDASRERLTFRRPKASTPRRSCGLRWRCSRPVDDAWRSPCCVSSDCCWSSGWSSPSLGAVIKGLFWLAVVGLIFFAATAAIGWNKRNNKALPRGY